MSPTGNTGNDFHGPSLDIRDQLLLAFGAATDEPVYPAHLLAASSAVSIRSNARGRGAQFPTALDGRNVYASAGPPPIYFGTALQYLASFLDSMACRLDSCLGCLERHGEYGEGRVSGTDLAVQVTRLSTAERIGTRRSEMRVTVEVAPFLDDGQ